MGLIVGGSVDINVLPEVGGLNGIVADNILDGGQRGIRCNNGPVPRHRIASTATIERNIVRNVSRAPDTPPPQPGFGFAIQIQNGLTTGSSWDVIVRNNRIYDNRIGVFIVGNQSSSSETNVLSMRNIVATNQAGMVIVSGFDGANVPGVNSDFQVISQEDRIIDNVGSPFLNRGGGVLAIAGANDTLAAAGSSGNQLRLLVRRAEGDYQEGGFALTDSQPTGTNRSNKAIMIGSNVAFEATNEVFDVPDEQPSLQP